MTEKDNIIDQAAGAPAITLHIVIAIVLIALIAYIAIEVRRSSEQKHREVLFLTKRVIEVEKRQDHLERDFTKEIMNKLEEARVERDSQLRALSEQIFQLANRGKE